MWAILRTKLVILVFLLCVAGVVSSQVSNVLPTSSNIANIQTARTDNWTCFHNPASLVQDAGWQLAAQYENRYFLPSLNTAMLQAGYTNEYVNVGVGYAFFRLCEVSGDDGGCGIGAIVWQVFYRIASQLLDAVLWR